MIDRLNAGADEPTAEIELGRPDEGEKAGKADRDA